MNTDFEYIVPWNGANDTGRDVRLKLERNFQKIANDLWELVENDNDLLDLINQRLSKVDDDTAAGLITFLKGIITDSIRSRQYTSGALGAGFAAYINNSGRSVAEVDELIVRVKAIFHELVIEILSHVGGEVILSPASMKCIRVEEQEDTYRCYFKSTDGDTTINNEFVLHDQARCQTFNIKPGVHENVSNRFYWRLVTGIGDDYIDLSKTDCYDNSDIPQVGDDIVQLGNRDPEQEERQNAIILSSYGPDAPSIKQYMYIDHYTLEGKECTVVSPHGNVFTGDFILKTGINIATQLQVLENLIKTEIQNIEYIINDADNYLTNASFTADLDNWITGSSVSVYEDNSSLLTVNEKLYAANESFVGLASYNGKYMLRIKNGFIKQLASVIKDPSNIGVFYVSFKYYCTEAGTLSCGFKNQELYNEIEITENRTPKIHEFSGVWDGTRDFILEFSGEIYVSLVSLTNKPLDDFKVEINSKFEQMADSIKACVTSINNLTNTVKESGFQTTADGTKIYAWYIDGDGKKKLSLFNVTPDGIFLDSSFINVKGVVNFESFTPEFQAAFELYFSNASMTAKDDIARQLGYTNYAQLVENAAASGNTLIVGGYLNTKLIDVATLLAGNIVSEMINTNGINIADRFIFNKDSKVVTLGNLKILESGALAGGNAVFEDVGKYMYGPWIPTLTEENFENYIIDRISKMTTIVIAPTGSGFITQGKTYSIYLPDLIDFGEHGVDTSYSFKLLIIIAGKTFGGPISIDLSNYDLRYNIKCRADNRHDVPDDPGLLEPYFDSRTYIRDNNYKIINSIDMAIGDTLELYYCNGDYYFINRSY